jgi:hypothetical protein
MSGARAWDNLLGGEGLSRQRQHGSVGLFGLSVDIVATNPLSRYPIGVNEGLLRPGPASRCKALNLTHRVGAQCNKFQPDLESPKAAEPWPWRPVRKIEPVQEHLHVRRRSENVEWVILLIFVFSRLVGSFLTEEFKIPAVSAANAEV